MINSVLDISWSVADDEFQIERTRFRSILRRYATAGGIERRKLRDVVLAYLRFSPQSDQLINEVIVDCVALQTSGRLDSAIDVLSQLNSQILRYATEFLINDIRTWNHLYPGRAYEPNDDYWYILLRSVGQSACQPAEKIQFVRMCESAASRAIVEAVLEALSDVGTDEAFAAIEQFTKHGDAFIADLAAEILSNR